MNTPTLSLVIPVYNEQANAPWLRSAICGLQTQLAESLREVVLVNNGSTDETGHLLTELKSELPSLIRIVTLETNEGYGGGVRAGFLNADQQSTHWGWIPADGQYEVDDIALVWTRCRKAPQKLHKGKRRTRSDSASLRIASAIYGWLCRLLLDFKKWDVNGLPKIVPAEWARTRLASWTENRFAWDALVLNSAMRDGLAVEETPVKFHSRRRGVSSWSHNRLRTYVQTVRAVWRIKQSCHT